MFHDLNLQENSYKSDNCSRIVLPKNRQFVSVHLFVRHIRFLFTIHSDSSWLSSSWHSYYGFGTHFGPSVMNRLFHMLFTSRCQMILACLSIGVTLVRPTVLSVVHLFVQHILNESNVRPTATSLCIICSSDRFGGSYFSILNVY